MTSTVPPAMFSKSRLYSGLAHEAEVVLIQVRDSGGDISSASISPSADMDSKTTFRARSPDRQPLGERRSSFRHWPETPGRSRVRIGGGGHQCVAAAGNDGQRSLLPPATAPLAITVAELTTRIRSAMRKVLYGTATTGQLVITCQSPTW